MRTLLYLLILSISLFANDAIKVATIPWQSKEELTKMYHPFIKLLEDRLHKKVVFFVTKDYAELSKRVLAKSVDIAIFGANSYVDAKYENPSLIYLATAMQPTDHYNSLIITRKDSDIESLEDLKGKTFGFTDVGSTSGYIYPNLMLDKTNINPKKDFKSITMLKKHYKVYGAVASGAIDAGGCTITYYKSAVQKYGDVFRILKKSAPIPQDPITIGSHVDEKLKKRIIEVLKDANSSGYFEKYPTKLKGLSIRDDAYYDIVREAKEFMKKSEQN